MQRKPKSIVGRRILQLQRKRKATLTEMAKELAWFLPQLHVLIYKVKQPRYKTLDRIAETFDVTIEWLLGEEDDKNNQKTKS